MFAVIQFYWYQIILDSSVHFEPLYSLDPCIIVICGGHNKSRKINIFNLTPQCCLFISHGLHMTFPNMQCPEALLKQDLFFKDLYYAFSCLYTPVQVVKMHAFTAISLQEGKPAFSSRNTWCQELGSQSGTSKQTNEAVTKHLHKTCWTEEHLWPYLNGAGLGDWGYLDDVAAILSPTQCEIFKEATTKWMLHT